MCKDQISRNLQKIVLVHPSTNTLTDRRPIDRPSVGPSSPSMFEVFYVRELSTDHQQTYGPWTSMFQLPSPSQNPHNHLPPYFLPFFSSSSSINSHLIIRFTHFPHFHKIHSLPKYSIFFNLLAGLCCGCCWCCSITSVHTPFPPLQFLDMFFWSPRLTTINFYVNLMSYLWVSYFGPICMLKV